MKLATTLAALAALAGCASDPPDAAPAAPPEASPPEPDAAFHTVARAQGGVVFRDGERLYVADEDRSALHAIALTRFGRADAQRTLALPGPPAAVIAHDGEVLVTIREPGMLLRLYDDGDDLREMARTPLPDDAWGIAITADGRDALVTSAWTRQLSRVSLDDMTLRWSLPVAREPRAIAVLDGDRAYLTHLVGAALTRIDGLSAIPKVQRIAFPAAPLRNPDDEFAEARSQAASLAYAGVLSPDGARLFVPRHALGATGKLAWNGQPTVDVLLTRDDSPLAEREGDAPLSRVQVPLERRDQELSGPGPIQRRPIFAQPRAAVYRVSTHTLLVASEGRDALVELDARSVDPSARALRRYELSPWEDRVQIDDLVAGDTECGAPSGIALSDDENAAYVFCRSTATLAAVSLRDAEEPVTANFRQPRDARVALMPLGDDPLDAEAALGRRLFYDAVDNRMSFGFSCAGCHPEGRDDGHVWQELPNGVMRAFPETQPWTTTQIRGEPRQTPMLAGRVDHDGPFGWRGESASLKARILRGFEMHHWYGFGWVDRHSLERAQALAAFLRSSSLAGGLVPPPKRRAPLDATEARGRALFDDATAGCAGCHTPATGFSDQSRVALDLRSPDDRFIGRESARFRTPSLSFVAGTEPYLHDGSIDTLEQLLEHNHDRMGITSHLGADDRRALVTYMHALDGPAPSDAFPVSPAPRRARAQSPPSPSPSEDQWHDAPALALARADERCDAQQLREWVRIRCRVHAAEVQLVGGSPEGVALSHSEAYVRPRDPRLWWDRPELVDDVVVVMPLRPGDRRLVQALFSGFVKWGGNDFDASLVISETWLEGQDAPTITVL